MRKNHILKAVSLIMSICLLLSVSGVLSLYTNADTTEPATKAVTPSIVSFTPWPYNTNDGQKMQFVSSKNKSISDNILYKSTSGEIIFSSDGGQTKRTSSLLPGLTDGDCKTNDIDGTRFYNFNEGKYVNGYNPDTMEYDENNITHYTELTYDLGSEKNVDEFWISTNMSADIGTAIYETYISDTKETLYEPENKLFTYVNHDKMCFQKFVFEERKGTYFGIKIIMGVISFRQEWTWARIGEVALFGQDNITVSTPKPGGDANTEAAWNDVAITETTSNGETIKDSIIYGKQASITYVDGGPESDDIKYQTNFINNLTDGIMKAQNNSVVDMNMPNFIKGYDTETGTFTYANGYDPSNYTYNANNLETYVNITYDLETEYDINEFWLFSANNRGPEHDFAVGVYELYASNSLDDLYDASNKKLVYVNKQEGEYAQKIHFDNSFSARYFGIKIINGCKKIAGANVDYSWPRISQIAIFGDKQITVKGDTNGDGVVNICDLVTFYKATLPEDGIATAKRYLDMNEDGFVKQDDMSDLQKGLLGVINLNRTANLLDYTSKEDGKTVYNWSAENYTLKSYCDDDPKGAKDKSTFNIINVKEGDKLYFYKNNALYTQNMQVLLFLFNKEGLVTRQIYINNDPNEPQGGISIQSGEYYMATAINTSETENAVWSVFKNNGGLDNMPETAFGYKPVGPDSELYTTYNAKSYLSNYWEGDTVYNESVFLNKIKMVW